MPPRFSFAAIVGRVKASTTQTPTPPSPTAAADVDADLGAINPKEPPMGATATTKPKAEMDPEKKDDMTEEEKKAAEAKAKAEAEEKKKEESKATDDTDSDDEKATAAGLSELKAAFPSDPSLVLEALEKGWSVPQAKAAAYDRMVAGQAKAAKVEKGLRGEGKGVPALAHSERGAAAGAKPTGAAAAKWPKETARHNPFFDHVAKLMDEQKLPEHVALRQARAERKDLYKAMMANPVLDRPGRRDKVDVESAED